MLRINNVMSKNSTFIIKPIVSADDKATGINSWTVEELLTQLLKLKNINKFKTKNIDARTQPKKNNKTKVPENVKYMKLWK